jgi:hypothetical protein
MIDQNMRQLGSYVNLLEGKIIDILGQNPPESAINSIKFTTNFPESFVWTAVVGDQRIQINTEANLYKDLEMSSGEFSQMIEGLLKASIGENFPR